LAAFNQNLFSKLDINKTQNKGEATPDIYLKKPVIIKKKWVRDN